jgi:nucleoside-diphosphate-sugar epimerase
MHVLVTGAAGYLGTVLCARLREVGHSVVGLDRCFFGSEGVPAGIPLIHGDIREWENPWLDNVDAVVHMAGLSNDPTSAFSPEANWQMNVEASDVIANACKNRGIKRITFASSASVYDDGIHSVEGNPPSLRDEDADVSPRGAYSNSKFHAERAMLEASAIILRQGTVYGYSPRMRMDLCVNTFVRDILTKGELTLHHSGSMYRPLIDIVDVADAHIAALESNVRGEVYNVVNENLQIREVAGIVAGAGVVFFNGHRDIRIKRTDAGPAIVRNYRVYGRKITHDLGWHPKRSIFVSATDMFERLSSWSTEQLYAPEYSNIRWMTMLERACTEQSQFGGIFSLTPLHIV